MQGVQSNSQSNSGGYRSPVVDDGLMEQTGGSSHSGRSIAVVSPSSLGPEDPPPPYPELIPDSLPTYWQAIGVERGLARGTMIQLANIRAAGRNEPVPPPELAHRRVECLNNAFCRSSSECLTRNWLLLLLFPTLSLLLCVIIVTVLKAHSISDP